MPPTNYVSVPVPGFYRRRMVRGGVWVAARIWVEDGERDPDTNELLSDQVIRCEVGGAQADPIAQWSYLAGQPITEAEFEYLMAAAAWAERHAPDAPEANPRAPIDLNSMPPLFGPGGRYA